MKPYGTKTLIKRMSEHYNMRNSMIKVVVNDQQADYTNDVEIVGARTISFMVPSHNLNIDGIRVPLSTMHTEDEFYDLIEHQIKYNVLQENNKRDMDIFFNIQQGLIVDRRTDRSATLYQNEFTLCEPKVMYIQSPNLKVSFYTNLLTIHVPRNPMFLEKIDRKKFDGGGIWVDIHLVVLKRIANICSLEKCSWRVTAMPEKGNGDMDSHHHQAELLHESWMSNFNVPADMFKNPLNGDIRDQYKLLEPENLYNGENVYTDRDLCTFVKIGGNWIAVAWEWVIHNQKQFPKEVQEELLMVQSLQQMTTGDQNETFS